MEGICYGKHEKHNAQEIEIRGAPLGSLSQVFEHLQTQVPWFFVYRYEAHTTSSFYFQNRSLVHMDPLYGMYQTLLTIPMFLAQVPALTEVWAFFVS